MRASPSFSIADWLIALIIIPVLDLSSLRRLTSKVATSRASGWCSGVFGSSGGLRLEHIYHHQV
jgi:hypothetical protein